MKRQGWGLAAAAPAAGRNRVGSGRDDGRVRGGRWSGVRVGSREC